MLMRGSVEMVKNEVLRLITDMEENVSLDEIMYHIYILDKHNKAMDDIKNGRLYTAQDIRESLGMS